MQINVMGEYVLTTYFSGPLTLNPKLLWFGACGLGTCNSCVSRNMQWHHLLGLAMLLLGRAGVQGLRLRVQGCPGFILNLLEDRASQIKCANPYHCELVDNGSHW